MGQQFGWWQLSSLHHRIATDIQVGKVRLAFKISLEAKLDVHTGVMWSQLWEEKVSIHILISVTCSLGGEVGEAAVAMESDLPLFLPSGSFFSFLIVSECLKPWGPVDCCSEIYISSHCDPFSAPSMDEVYFSTLQHWVWQSLSLAFGMIVGQLYQRFKMSNALGIALWRFVLSLWKERAWGGPRWSQEEDSRPVEHRDTSLTPPARPTSKSVPSDLRLCVGVSLDWENSTYIWDQLTSCWSSDVWVK